MAQLNIQSVGFSGHLCLAQNPLILNNSNQYNFSQQGPEFITGNKSIDINLQRGVVGDPTNSQVMVYTITGNTWVLYTTLTPVGFIQSGDDFGYAVSVTDNIISVGSPGWNNNTGAVYIFENHSGTWQPAKQFQLTAIDSSIETSARFGEILDLSSTLLAVGVPKAKAGGTTLNPNGAVYVFSNLNYQRIWYPHNKIFNTSGNSNIQFGSVINLYNDNHLFIGASNSPINSGITLNQAGIIYIYTRISTYSWSNSSNIQSPNPISGAQFGYSLKAESGKLIVGSPYEQPGSVYYFEGENDSWIFQQQFQANNNTGIITDNNITENSLQGYSVNIDTERNLIFWGDTNTNSGIVYMIEKTQAGNWVPSINNKLLPNDGINGDSFGYNIILNTPNLYIVSPNHTNGSVYNFG